MHAGSRTASRARWGRLCLLLAALVARSAEPAVEPGAEPTGYLRLMQEAALTFLREGNERFASGRAQHPNPEPARRPPTAQEGEEPLAAILGCSDSRVPVELIFDRGIGDMFVVRVASNVAGPSELASLEYGAGHLHIPLLVVLGHTGCGAVTAVVQGVPTQDHFPRLAAKILPAARQAMSEKVPPDQLVLRAIEANVRQAMADVLSQSRGIRDLVAAGRLQVVGAVYDLETGKVRWLGPHPYQQAIMAEAREKEPRLVGEPSTGSASKSR